MKHAKYKMLWRSILFDAIGMVTLIIPTIGPFLDIIWAPIAAKLMVDMYPGKKGKIAAVVAFLEEILPITDVIPTFTLMWLYSYILNNKTTQEITNTNITSTNVEHTDN